MNGMMLIDTAQSRSDRGALRAVRYPCADDTQIVLNQAVIAPGKENPRPSRHLPQDLWAIRTHPSMPATHQHALHPQVETT